MIRYNTKRYWGYSTDTKPINSQIGDRFLEMDTQIEYMFSNYNEWVLIGYVTPPFTGGTVSGETYFSNGLTATTISAATYQNLPQDIFVTGGTYNNGEVIFTNNSGGTFTVTGFPIGGGGGQTFYLNLSQSQGGNRLLSTTASTASEQTSGVTINNGLTGTIASFQSQPLNTTLLPGGVWSFYLHSYKEDSNASFDIFVEVYKRTSGGTQTLLFTTDPSPVTTNSPNPSMQLTDGYFSGTPLSVSDSIVAVVRATNTGNQTKIITLVTEGSSYYSYVVSTLPTQQGLTCETLSGCSIIQTIQTNISNKFDKSGGTINGNLTATTISATTYQNLPIDIRVTGATKLGTVATFTNNTGGTFTLTGLTDTFVTGATKSGDVATFTNNTGGTFTLTGLTDTIFTGGTVTGATNFTNGLTANTFSSTTISATTYNGYVPLPTEASSTTGVTLSFITDSVYGTLSSPETGTTITANTTNALLGVTNIIIHSGSTSPTFSSQYKKLTGSGNYSAGTINYIFTTYITSTEIIYSINQRT
jgi:hypothetical protein